MTAEQKAVIPAIGVSFSVPVGKGDSTIGMTFQTHFAGDVSAEEMDRRLDLYMGRAARQQKIGRIPEVKASIRQHEQSIRNLTEDIERLDRQNAEKWKANNRKGAPELPTADRTNRENAMVNLGRFKEMLGKLQDELAEYQELTETPKSTKAAKAA